MALIPDNVPTKLDADDVAAQFGIAQAGKPTDAQLAYQRDIAGIYVGLAQRINADVADCDAKSQALLYLQAALMWTGKAIFL